VITLSNGYYTEQLWTPYWAESPGPVRTALVEMAGVAVAPRGLAVDAGVLVPLAVGALLLLLLKK